MPDGFSFEDLKPAEHEGFSLEDVLKPAKKKPDHIGDLLREYDETGQKASGVAGRIIEAMRQGYREGFEGMPSLLSPEAQAKLDATQREGGVKGAAANVASLAAEDVRAPFAVLPGLLRGGQAGVQQLGKEMGDERLGREVAAIPEAFPFGVGELGAASRGGAEPGRPPPPRARIEPTMPGGPRPALPSPEGFSLEEAGITPTPEPTPGAAPKPGSTPLAEAGITPTPEPTAPVPAAETETVAVPQADGTVKQVQVKTGEPPPPGEAPAPTTAEAPPTGPVNPADLRAGFPDLSDEQFEALFQQANREVPRPTTNDPADQQAWMKSVMGVMARLAVPAAAEEQKPTRITTAQVQARDGVGAVEAGKRAAAENAAQEQQKPTDEWAPVAVAPVDQPDQETPIAQAPGIAAETPPVSSETTAAPVNQPKVDVAPAPSPEAPAPESAPAPIEAHGGPWTRTGKQNHLGEDVFENPNGVRAIMDNGVPWTEATKETDKGLVPKNPGNRKRQHLTTDEPWAESAPGKSENKPEQPKPAKSPPKIANSPTKTETAEKPKADWSFLGKNADSRDVYENPQGVHSTLVDGIRTVEAVRLKPTPQGMAMSVPAPVEKDPQFQVVTPATETGPEVDQKGTESVPVPAEAHPDSTPVEVPIDEPPDELVGALNTLSGGRTQQTPTGEAPPAEEPPEELQGQSTGYKPRREYNKHLTNQAEIAANKLTVDALNGDIPEKNAVAGLGELVRRGGLSEGAALVNLSRLNDWNEGEWAKATSSDSSTTDEAAKPEAPKPFDGDEFDRARNERVAASRAAGNTHLDTVPMGVETMRGKVIQYVHNPEERGVISTVTNRGQIYVKWEDGPNAGNESFITDQDAKDFIVTGEVKPKQTRKPKSVPAEAPKAEEPAAPPVDLKGIPKTVYRGTGRANVASAYNGVAEPIAGPGRYSAFAKSDAEKFGPNVEEAPIDLKKPLVIRSDPEWRALTKEAGWEFPNPYGMEADKFKAAAAKLKEVVQSKGHDGIIAWWNNDTPNDVDDQGRSIKTLRNALGVPQVIDYREPKAASEEAPKVDEPVSQMKKRDMWYVDHATPEELTRILGENWVIARDTPANRKRHSEDAKFISRKTYNEAQAQALAERATKDTP